MKTLTEVVQAYLAAPHEHCTKRAAASLRKILEFTGDIRLDRLTPDVLAKYRSHRSQTSKPGTIWRDMVALRTVLRWASMDHIKVPIPEQPPPRVDFLTPDEVTKVVNDLGDTPLWFEAATLMLFYTGQRVDAILGMKWEQVDERAKVIDFNRGIGSRQKKRAVLPITSQIQAVLDVADRRGRYVITKGIGDPDTQDRDRPIQRTYRYWWDKVVKRATGRHVCVHAIRHSVATNLVRAGVSLHEVSRMLGHSSIITTERVYAKYSPEFARTAMERAASIVGIR